MVSRKNLNHLFIVFMYKANLKDIFSQWQTQNKIKEHRPLKGK